MSNVRQTDALWSAEDLARRVVERFRREGTPLNDYLADPKNLIHLLNVILDELWEVVEDKDSIDLVSEHERLPVQVQIVELQAGIVDRLANWTK